MTATHVNGVAVIADEAAPSPLSRPDRPVSFPQIRRLLLEDDSETYGCALCEHTDPALGKVRYHLRSHPERVVSRRSRRADVSADVSVRDLVALARSAERLRKERDEWRQRALKLQRQLATAHRALAP
ncbi:hypothetical protein [Nonomuraea glycinis]|uniref:hypothetical protein n=1 Tax=Nonomuraea glycinis TaxID=2047744 RepID=UPI0033A63811